MIAVALVVALLLGGEDVTARPSTTVELPLGGVFYTVQKRQLQITRLDGTGVSFGAGGVSASFGGYRASAGLGGLAGGGGAAGGLHAEAGTPGGPSARAGLGGAAGSGAGGGLYSQAEVGGGGPAAAAGLGGIAAFGPPHPTACQALLCCSVEELSSDNEELFCELQISVFHNPFRLKAREQVYQGGGPNTIVQIPAILSPHTLKPPPTKPSPLNEQTFSDK
uniref:Uncharacterized protein n=1 Tax=Timema bartmani TaxID=61472 RepID=A0A7R9I070_9NEOP|nr:unnamed protein product [Timema bartmani]